MRIEHRYFFYGFRTVFLLTTIIFSLAWLALGFDSTVDTMFNDDPSIRGVGLHWSTLNGMTLLFYFIMINYQVGGLKSLGQLWAEVKIDLKALFSGRYFHYRTLQSKRINKTNAILAAISSSLLVVFALFVFEYPYVFMLNYFHFGSLLFPVYTYDCYNCLINSTHSRNILGLFMIIPLLFLNKGFGFSKYRIDKHLLFLVFVSATVWLAWIIIPPSHQVKDYDYFQNNPQELYLANETLLYGFDTKGWTWPNQKIFPQTIYIIINATRENPYHFREDLDGWWQDDPPVHALNVLTKYMVFISVGYLFMVRIEEDKRCLNRLNDI